jgi:hypothetical protein
MAYAYEMHRSGSILRYHIHLQQSNYHCHPLYWGILAAYHYDYKTGVEMFARTMILIRDLL